MTMERGSSSTSRASGVATLHMGGNSSGIDRLEQIYLQQTINRPQRSLFTRRRLAVPMPIGSAANYVCDGEMLPEERKQSRMLLSPKLRGVNLGGWMVLTPWLTPSLFYQFEDKPSEQTALDMHSFCRVLGPAEGNRQLREHWSKWVTDDDLAQLASQGINTLRVPVGDWMWEPYEPYTGCTNGSVTELRRMLRRCEKHGLRVLIDLHGEHASARSLLPSPRTTLSLRTRVLTPFFYFSSLLCCAAALYTRRRAPLSERLRQFRPRDEHLVGGRRHAFRPLAVPVCRVAGLVRSINLLVLEHQLG